MAMRLQLFDTSTLIPMIRGEAYELLFRRALRSGRARMSSVVMQELYAGARAREDKRGLDAINRAFLRRGYVVTPDHDDWILAGLLLARHQRLKGVLEPREHINDVLIVLDASKLGADLVTENSSDMERWRRMLPRGRRAFRVERVARSEHRLT
jgi:predicted nucleic acid-binding protein